MRHKRHWEGHRGILGNKIESLRNQEQSRTVICEEAPGKNKQRISSVRVTAKYDYNCEFGAFLEH